MHIRLGLLIDEHARLSIILIHVLRHLLRTLSHRKAICIWHCLIYITRCCAWIGTNKSWGRLLSHNLNRTWTDNISTLARVDILILNILWHHHIAMNRLSSGVCHDLISTHVSRSCTALHVNEEILLTSKLS